MKKKEYIIIGDNDYWYASEIWSLKEAMEKVEYIKKHKYMSSKDPSKLYILKVERKKEIDI